MQCNNKFEVGQNIDYTNTFEKLSFFDNLNILFTQYILYIYRGRQLKVYFTLAILHSFTNVIRNLFRII